jgi:NAD(P)-dependent dehydrogenase (short-subunit alcohol dehydrogenase family)
MDLEVKDKICVVTGASKGIGLAITQALVAGGAVVVAGARDRARHARRRRSRSTRRTGPACEGRGRRHGRIDVLVNNVGGVQLRMKGFLGTSDEEFEWAMNINFFAALRATRAAEWPWRGDRERFVCERILPARYGHRGLRRGKGRACQSDEGALAEARTA